MQLETKDILVVDGNQAALDDAVVYARENLPGTNLLRASSPEEVGLLLRRHPEVDGLATNVNLPDGYGCAFAGVNLAIRLFDIPFVIFYNQGEFFAQEADMLAKLAKMHAFSGHFVDATIVATPNKKNWSAVFAALAAQPTRPRRPVAA